MKRRAIALLAAAHLFDDVNQGVVPGAPPVLHCRARVHDRAAAGLVFALERRLSRSSSRSSASSRTGQPALGSSRAACLLAGAGVALTGLAPTYALVLAAAAVTGIGVAAFHPEAARQVYLSSGKRRAMAMSFFAVGGNLGFAIGPALATPLQLRFGLRGTILLVLPALAMALVLLRTGSAAARPPTRFPGKTLPGASRTMVAFLRLSAPVICRAIVFYGLNTFIPLYWIQSYGASKAAGATA
jgi:FSR family fosmidomycin resistance protein-like MFS transporter